LEPPQEQRESSAFGNAFQDIFATTRDVIADSSRCRIKTARLKLQDVNHEETTLEIFQSVKDVIF
jgi:hypothetical protein